MARIICVAPCVPTQISVPIPFMGSMTPVQNFDLKLDCSNCGLLGSMMIQINPFLTSLGIPLCALGCIVSVIGVLQALEDALGPPPDPTKIVSAIVNVLAKCKCILDSALPPPAGPICQFLKFVSSIVSFCLSIIDCLLGLLGHIATLQLQATNLLLKPDPSFQQIAGCLQVETSGLIDMLMGKFNAVSVIFTLMEPIFSLINVLIPIPALSNISSAFSAFTGSVSSSPPLQIVVGALNDLATAMNIVASALADAVVVCP